MIDNRQRVGVPPLLVVLGLLIRAIPDSSATAWLPEEPNQAWCGFDPGGWPASCWILHAMYETDSLPDGLTHDDVWRIEEAAASPATRPEAGRRIRELLDRGTLVGTPGGKSARPQGPWTRLLWGELIERFAIDPFADGRLPSYSSFPFRSWPISVRAPAEGALDREQYRQLLQLLAEFSAYGLETSCIVRYGPCWDMERPHTFQGTIRDAIGQYDDPSQRGAPNNVWPEDKSWFIYTDYDLLATKVSGDDALVAAIRQDDELETQALPV